MKKIPGFIAPNEKPLSIAEFLETYNKLTPVGFPLATIAKLQKFKEEHLSLFKTGGSWTLDQHRKRLIDWLPQNV